MRDNEKLVYSGSAMFNEISWIFTFMSCAILILNRETQADLETFWI